jgi:hypothetical protein
MSQQFQPVTILRALAESAIPEAGIKQGDTVYLARDTSVTSTDRFFVVKWERVRWVCSCGKRACDHQRQVNTFVFERIQKERTTNDPEELTAHLRDEFRIES